LPAALAACVERRSIALRLVAGGGQPDDER
jgi:hypothetical protein